MFERRRDIALFNHIVNSEIGRERDYDISYIRRTSSAGITYNYVIFIFIYHV